MTRAGGAMAIGLAAGLLCFVGATTLKRRMGYDDSLDAFGVHGVGGLVGSILTGVFAAASMGGSEAVTISHQLEVQATACAATAAWSGAMTWVLHQGRRSGPLDPVSTRTTRPSGSTSPRTRSAATTSDG